MILGDVFFAIEGIVFLTGTCWVFNSAERTLKLNNKVEENINKNAINSLEKHGVEVEKMLLMILKSPQKEFFRDMCFIGLRN